MKQKKFSKKQDDFFYPTNYQIKSKEVRIIGDNIESKVCLTSEAIKIAKSEDLDLILVSPNANPPVARIEEYTKFVYKQKKKKKELESNTSKTKLKEIRYTPNTGDHDYAFKFKHLLSFIKDKHKVKVTIFFKGREIVFKNKGYDLLQQIADDASEVSEIESKAKLEGKRLSMILKPKK